MTKMNSPKLELLEYALATEVRAFSTERAASLPESPYDGFSITHYCGDDETHVSSCRRALCEELGITDNRLLLPQQTHGCTVQAITQDHLTLSAPERQAKLIGVDALITDVRNVCIGVSTADCIPILLYDPKNRAIAAIHAGWRGTVMHLPALTAEAMNRQYGSHPSDLLAVIGPGISLEAFEVGDEVYDAFTENGHSMSQIARRFPAAGGTSKWHIDLWAANALILEKAGVPFQNIMVAGLCTFITAPRFFSARRYGIKSGRIFNGIMLR